MFLWILHALSKWLANLLFFLSCKACLVMLKLMLFLFLAEIYINALWILKMWQNIVLEDCTNEIFLLLNCSSTDLVGFYFCLLLRKPAGWYMLNLYFLRWKFGTCMCTLQNYVVCWVYCAAVLIVLKIFRSFLLPYCLKQLTFIALYINSKLPSSLNRQPLFQAAVAAFAVLSNCASA